MCLFLVTSPYVILFILTMLLFFLFSWVEGFKPTRTELELTMFSLFLTVWFYFVMYREALLMHGYKIIWQNIPNEVINQYFTDIDILTILYQVGLIPIITGLIVIYYYLFKKKKKSIYFLLSLGIIIGVLLLQKHIILNVGLIYIGVLLILLLGEFMNNIITYIDQTKFSRLKNLFLLGFLILFIFTSFFHSINVAKEKVIQSDPAGKVFALQFLHNISKEGDMVIGSVFDGHLITYTSKRKNMIDTNFLQIDASERLRDLRTIYTSAIISGPIDVMRKYDADFILLTQEAKDYYKITKLAYVDDECFPVIYSGQDVQVYQRKC